MCIWICTVKDAKLLIVLTLGSRRRRYFQLLLFPILFFLFSTSMYYICSLKQKHKSLPGSFPTPLKPAGQARPKVTHHKAELSLGTVLPQSTMDPPAASLTFTQMQLN